MGCLAEPPYGTDLLVCHFGEPAELQCVRIHGNRCVPVPVSGYPLWERLRRAGFPACHGPQVSRPHRSQGYCPMSFPLCSPAVLRSLVLVLIFCGAVGAGTSFLIQDKAVVGFFMAQPKINGTIVSLGLLALAMCLWELLRMFLQASRMDSLARSLSKGDRGGNQVTAIDAVKKLGRGLVKRRCERVSSAPLPFVSFMTT